MKELTRTLHIFSRAKFSHFCTVLLKKRVQKYDVKHKDATTFTRNYAEV